MIKQQIKVAHILGNGPSLSLFNRNDWSDEHLFVGCNFSDEKLRPDLTIMIDAKAIMQFYQGYKLSIPLVISNICEKFILNEKSGWQSLAPDAFQLVEVIDQIKIHSVSNSYPMNSGHHAVWYALSKHSDTLRDIYLWGTDTFWSDDLASNTDPIVGRGNGPRIRETVAQAWRNYWLHLFSQNSSVTFHITIPEGKELNTTFYSVKNLVRN